MRVEHWSNAIEQGAVAARNLLAGTARSQAFGSVPYFWSDQYELHIQSAGRPGAEATFFIVDDTPTVVVLSGTDGILTGVIAVGASKLFVRARRMVARRRDLGDAITELGRLIGG